MSHDQSSVDREIALQNAFDDAAEELDLQLVKGPTGAEEPRMVGALAPAAHVTTDVDDSDMPISIEDDDAAIAAVIEKWETADKDQLLEAAKEVAHDPYVIIKPVPETDGSVSHTAQIVDHDYFGQWVKSDTFQELANQFEPKDPREVEISGLSINYLGSLTASVVYKSRENGAKGTYVSNVAAFMVKEDGSWLYIAMTRSAQVS
jgi:hypothetical protein